jgi:hypothetical protein
MLAPIPALINQEEFRSSPNLRSEFQMKLRELLSFGFFLAFLTSLTAGTDAQAQTLEHYARERGVTRVGATKVSLSSFTDAAADRFTAEKNTPAAPQRMRIDFFPDVSLQINLKNVEPQGSDSLAWFGDVEGAPLGSAVFVLTPTGLIGAVSRGDGKMYQVRDGGRRKPVGAGNRSIEVSQ